MTAFSWLIIALFSTEKSAARKSVGGYPYSLIKLTNVAYILMLMNSVDVSETFAA